MSIVDEFVNKMRSLLYPKKPSKPSRPTGGTADAYMLYAEKLKEYEKAFQSYRGDIAIYQEALRKIDAEFKARALEDCGLNTLPNANDVYSYAWEQGHSKGYHDVYACLSEIADLFQPYVNKDKWVESVPRNPCDYAKMHVGGQ